MAIGAALIGAGGSILGSAMNSIFGSSAARKQRKAQKELAEYQYSKNLEMWNRNNEYNTPKNQMQRLKDANLNPNLMYGQGTTGNTSGQLPQYQSYTPEYHKNTVDIPNILTSLNMYQDYKNKGVQHDNLSQQTKLLQKEQDLKILSQLKTMADTSKSIAEKNRINKLVTGQQELLERQIKSEKMRGNMLGKDWQNYSQYGIRPTDSIMYRGAAQLWQEMKNAFSDQQKRTGKMLRLPKTN